MKVSTAAVVPVGKSESSALGWVLGSALVVGIGVGVYFLLQEEDVAPEQRIAITIDDQQMGLTTR